MMRSSAHSEGSAGSLRMSRRSLLRTSDGSTGMDVSSRLIAQLTSSQRNLMSGQASGGLRSSQCSVTSASGSHGAMDASTSMEFAYASANSSQEELPPAIEDADGRSSASHSRRMSLSLSLTLDKIEEGLVESKQFAAASSSGYSSCSDSDSDSDNGSASIHKDEPSASGTGTGKLRESKQGETHEQEPALVPLWRNPHLCMMVLVWLTLAMAVIVPTHFLLYQQQHLIVELQDTMDQQTYFSQEDLQGYYLAQIGGAHSNSPPQSQSETPNINASTTSDTSSISLNTSEASTGQDQKHDDSQQKHQVHGLLAHAIHHASSQSLQNTITQLQQLSLSMTFFAEATSSQWPLIPPNPYFQMVAQQVTTAAAGKSPLSTIGFAPIIQNQAERDNWQEMTLNRNDVARANTIYAFQLQDDGTSKLVNQNGSPPYAPIWQLHGTPSDSHSDLAMNWDLLSHPIFQAQLQHLNQTTTTSSSSQQYQPRPMIPVAMSDMVQARDLPWEEDSPDNTQWKTIITLPVWDTQGFQDDSTSDSGATQQQAPQRARVMRGLVFGVISWADLLLQQSNSFTQSSSGGATAESVPSFATSALISNNCRDGDSPVEITMGSVGASSSNDPVASLEQWMLSEHTAAATEASENDGACHYRMAVRTYGDNDEDDENTRAPLPTTKPAKNSSDFTSLPLTTVLNESISSEDYGYDSDSHSSGNNLNEAAIWWPLAMAGLFLVAGFILLAILVRVILLQLDDDDDTLVNDSGSRMLRASPATAEDQASQDDGFSFYEIECNLLETKGKVEEDDDELTQTGPFIGGSRKAQILSFIEEVNKMAINNPIGLLTSKPLADIFLNTTILYCDIAMFTAWASQRDPTEIFRLLEVIYQAFNEIAVAQDILTLDAIGDCYVACAGISMEKQQHALKMASFSLQAVSTMKKVTSALEVTFGPDTSKLSLRVGLNSGPVTLGVLRCAGRSRLQLFGHNVDLAAKMESTGQPDRIHVSPETQKLLEMAGKSTACIPRQDKVQLREFEEPIQTYWLVDESLDTSTNVIAKGVAQKITTKSVNTFLNAAGSFMQAVGHEEEEDVDNVFQGDHRRLIDWNVDRILEVLKKLVAKRLSLGLPIKATGDMQTTERLADNATVMDAVEDVIDLPEYCAMDEATDIDSIEINQDVVTELYELVTIISTLYRKNPFHNFEHASHVVQSVIKLNNRIASQDGRWDDEVPGEPYSKENSFSYIASDPLVQLAFIFSALIHDADHTGVPNDQLIKEGARIARIYKNESVAEQNSYDIAIDLLMEPMYSSLRGLIFATKEEMKFFLQLTKQAVIATDIMNKNLKDLRNARWAKAFAKPEEEKREECPRVDANRKGTIFIEHLIQASDVSHTMQHWHIFRKWNQRLFDEMYEAYKSGRSAKDPSEFWYKGEIGFFDFYIIPLAKKLKDCGVFGVFSDEYLNNAIRNRNEWEKKGQDIVAQMIIECQKRQMAQAQKTLSEARALLQTSSKLTTRPSTATATATATPTTNANTSTNISSS